MIYVPEELIINKENKEKIFEIVSKASETCIETPEIERFDVVGELRKMGEYKLAEDVKKGKLTT